MIAKVSQGQIDEWEILRQNFPGPSQMNLRQLEMLKRNFHLTLYPWQAHSDLDHKLSSLPFHGKTLAQIDQGELEEHCHMSNSSGTQGVGNHSFVSEKWGLNPYCFSLIPQPRIQFFTQGGGVGGAGGSGALANWGEGLSTYDGAGPHATGQLVILPNLLQSRPLRHRGCERGSSNLLA